MVLIEGRWKNDLFTVYDMLNQHGILLVDMNVINERGSICNFFQYNSLERKINDLMVTRNLEKIHGPTIPHLSNSIDRRNTESANM